MKPSFTYYMHERNLILIQFNVIFVILQACIVIPLNTWAVSNDIFNSKFILCRFFFFLKVFKAFSFVKQYTIKNYSLFPHFLLIS